jgi:hypothetical protein
MMAFIAAIRKNVPTVQVVQAVKVEPLNRLNYLNGNFDFIAS